MPADARVKDWFLMSSPWPMLIIVWLYLHFVRKLGPQLMAKRKPFNLERIIQIYNIAQVLSSLYVFVKIAWTVWLYFIIKVIDLLDTVFFVLRKKQNQVTFLHLYHHTSMVIGSWIVTKYIPGGHVTFIGALNSFVHVIMYTHYFVTSLKLAKPWWKKYLTQLQLVQFLLIIYHFAQLIWTPNCGFPMWPGAVLIPQNIFIFVLFLDFYRKAYVKKGPAKTKTGNGHANSIEDTATTDESKLR